MDTSLGVLPFLFTELYPYVMTIGVWYVALRFVQAYERRGVEVEAHHALSDRVRILEDVLDRVEDRVDRSDEVQRFTTSVLAARLGSGVLVRGTPPDLREG